MLFALVEPQHEGFCVVLLCLVLACLVVVSRRHAFFLKESGWVVDLGRKGDEEKLGVVKGRKLWLEVIV